MTQQGPVGRRFYGIAEIAEALGVDRQLATVWRRRSSHGMPRPDDELAAGPLWLAETIEPWIRATRARLETGGGRSVTPDLVRTATRRMLRLAALLLEEPQRTSEIRAMLTSVSALSTQLPPAQPQRENADSNPTRRVLTDVVEYVEELGAWLAQAGSGAPVPEELVVRCLQFVQTLARAVNSSV
jgi:hypothetical protein